MTTNRFPCELEGWNIVLRGNFNPAIFQPMWFAKHELISMAEAEDARIDIIRPELTNFRVGSMQLLVTLDKFQLDTATAEMAEVLKDLVLGTFHVLHETPAIQLGINRQLHFRMPSEEEWHQVGHKLAPKDLWTDLIEQPGTKSLVMQGKRPGASSQFIRATVQPSEPVRPGVFMGTNEHFEKPADRDIQWLLDTLRAEWTEAQTFAKHLGEEVIDRCLQ
jgi:hypothetical protein